MLKHLKLIRIYIFSIIKAEMEYRLNFILGIFANILTYFLIYFSMYIITHRYGFLDGWNYKDLILLTSLDLFAYAIAVTWCWSFMVKTGENIRNGKIDLILCRPISLIFQLLMQSFAWTGIGQIIISGTYFIFICSSFNLTICQIFLLILFIFSSSLIQMGSMIIFGALNFWTPQVENLRGLVLYDMRNLIKYPISLYNNYIQFILTFILPWAFINYYPLKFLLHKYSEFHIIYVLNPIVGISIFLGSLFFLKISINKYQSTGS